MREIKFKVLAAGALSIAALPTLGHAAGNISPSTASIMGNNCFSCHGPNGKSPGSIPSLNGKKADFIVKTMKEFSSGERPSTVMGRHAKGYTDAEIEAMANYLSSLK